MKWQSWALLLALLIGLGSCSNNSSALFPSDVVTQAKRDLQKKLDYLGIEQSPIDALDKSELTRDELNALTFIYAYSNTSDMLDHTPEFHLENIRVALKAREELPWGKKIPADQFRHFVLPLRVNNEILDNFRVAYYEELRDLVKDLSMEEAVLELNHWSHQHITYTPSDGRTSSPLATLRNALGRCGEQSTFVTAVLRTVGIPARQVYTPRWAHTDSNHAWVEAWVDGQWHYFGASEPAPVLDNAWFDAPVLRAMILHTRAFGPYLGSEEWLGSDAVSTELNVTSNYVANDQALVRVLNADSTPAEGATVTFRLYNYGELYPIVTRTTNRLGEAYVYLGHGDVMVVASKDASQMAIGKMSITEGGASLELTLADYADLPETLQYRITPPVEQVPLKEITPEMEEANNARMAENNRIRGAYTATFPTAEEATNLAQELGLSSDDSRRLERLLVEARGYGKEIADFVRECGSKGRASEAIALLAMLREKDLHDVDIEVLEQAMARPLTEEERRDYRIVSPRVMLEHLYPAEAALEEAVAEIAEGLNWENMTREKRATTIRDHLLTLRVDDKYNPLKIVLNPATVWQYKMGDERSLTVLLVRLLRTAKIPAIYDDTNKIVVFWDEQDERHLLPFLESDPDKEVKAEATLQIEYTPVGYLKTPKYQTNFTVGYVGDDGQIGTYGFPFGQPYNEVNGTELIYANSFVSTGVRLADGTVLLRMDKIKEGQKLPLTFDHDSEAVSVIGSLDAESLYLDTAEGVEKSILSSTGRGFYLLVLARAHHEPTHHILRDIQGLADETGQLPLPVVALTDAKTAPADELMALLPQAIWGQDTQGIAKKVAEGSELPERLELPVVVVCDTFNRVVFISQGYTIGIGEHLAAVINEVK